MMFERLKSPKYYVTTTEDSKLLLSDGSTIFVYDVEQGWVRSFYWQERMLDSDFKNYKEVSEAEAYSLSRDLLQTSRLN